MQTETQGTRRLFNGRVRDISEAKAIAKKLGYHLEDLVTTEEAIKVTHQPSVLAFRSRIYHAVRGIIVRNTEGKEICRRLRGNFTPNPIVGTLYSNKTLWLRSDMEELAKDPRYLPAHMAGADSKDNANKTPRKATKTSNSKKRAPPVEKAPTSKIQRSKTASKQQSVSN